MKIFKYISAAFLAATLLAACGKDFLETEDTAYLGEEEAAEAAGENPDVFLNGMWSFMSTSSWTSSGHDCFNFMAILMMANCESEDLAFYSAHYFVFDYQFDYRAENYIKSRIIWSVFYTLIDRANAILTLYPEGGSSAGEKALIGQAYAIRGMSYTYLVQHYQFPVTADGAVNGDAPAVPIIYNAADGKTEEEMEAAKGRNPLKDVYAVIEGDLTKAVENLEAAKELGYVRPSKNYIDVNVAYGFLARYYLLSQQWDKAVSAAQSARAGYEIMSAAEILDGFCSSSNREWMWSFAHTTETQTTYASFFSHMASSGPGYGGTIGCTKMIDARLYAQMAEDDARRAWFNGPDGDPSKTATASAARPYANQKFGFISDWTMHYLYMRAAEMLLIEAEAKAHAGDETGAATVLQELMAKRQPSWNETSVTAEDVYFQRRLELWGEGHSYFDLKRLNKGVDRDYEGSNHLSGSKLQVPAQDYRWNYQIPLSELQENKHISEEDQNE